MTLEIPLTEFSSAVDSSGRRVLRFRPKEWHSLEAKLNAHARLTEQVRVLREALKEIRAHHVVINARINRPLTESSTIALCDAALEQTSGAA